MDVDSQESSSDSEEVNILSLRILRVERAIGRILYSGRPRLARGQAANCRILNSTVCLVCRSHARAHFLRRARARVERQKEDSQLPLQQIIDIRKRVFTELKVYAQ